MAYSLTDYRQRFKNYVGDDSLSNTICDMWLTPSYVDAWKLLWNSNSRRELPITITKQMPLYDNVLLSYYILVPDTVVARHFPDNDQINQRKVGNNYYVYLDRGRTYQTIEMMAKVTYPIAAGVYDSDLVAKMICLDAAYWYLDHIKSFEESDRKLGQRTEIIQEIRQKYAQQFIYNSNDGYEEVKVNVP